MRPFLDLILTLRAERDRQGLSLGDVAERTGMDRSAIHKLEIGLNRNPTYATLARYAAALGVAIDWKPSAVDRMAPRSHAARRPRRAGAFQRERSALEYRE